MNFHSVSEETKIVLKIRVAKAILAIFEVTERKATTGVGELESKKIKFISHPKPCLRVWSRTAPE